MASSAAPSGQRKGREASTGTGSLPLLPTPSEHQAHVSSVPPDHLAMMLQRYPSHMPPPPSDVSSLLPQMYLPSSLKPWTPLPSHLAYLVPCGQMPGLPHPPSSHPRTVCVAGAQYRFRASGKTHRFPARGVGHKWLHCRGSAEGKGSFGRP